MECSMCGDVGFQISLFQCSKCLMRFQHQYCSRAYFESMSELCDWCFAIEEEFDIRNSVKSVRNSAGLEKCTNITHKRNLRKRNLVDKKKRSDLGDSMDTKLKKRYKLLHEILC